MSASSPATLPFDLRVELTGLGDDLRRWLRLRKLWIRARADAGVSSAQLEPLVTALEAAFDAAAEEAEKVAAFLEANAEAIDALLDAHVAAGMPNSAAPDAARKALGEGNGGRAASVAARLRGLPALREQELEALRVEYGPDEGVPAADAGSALCAIENYMYVTAMSECDQIFNPQACAEADRYITDMQSDGCLRF